jgi:hypothetical protein
MPGLILGCSKFTLACMSVAELAKSIARLTPDQQAAVMRFIAKVRRSNSPARRRKLANLFP